MEKENIVMLMDQLIKETGRMIKKMEKENIVVLMGQLFKETGRMVKRFDEINIFMRVKQHPLISNKF
jgi:hypothetical protein